ncbi:hypothetical protein V1478_001158 [Vespula squamosa]|uniref:Uncharacterized protein n=1 Tax=Vespula squamosa TaxID=30214 RepID=A0ABD2C7K1_VESSQ
MSKFGEARRTLLSSEDREASQELGQRRRKLALSLSLFLTYFQRYTDPSTYIFPQEFNFLSYNKVYRIVPVFNGARSTSSRKYAGTEEEEEAAAAAAAAKEKEDDWNEAKGNSEEKAERPLGALDRVVRYAHGSPRGA